MAKQVILERVEPFNKVIDEPFAKLIGDDEGVAPRSRSAPGVDDRDIAATRAKLRLAAEDKRRSYPNVSDATSLAWAWRSLSETERAALVAADDTGQDPIFDRDEAVAKGSIATSTIQALAELRMKKDPKLTTIEKARVEVRATHVELARREREARQALA